MIDLQALCAFLVKAKKSTYAQGDNAQKIIEKDRSKTLVFEEGNRKYHDNYFGGEPYSGREVVFFEKKPAYIMTYYGRVDKKIDDVNKIYKILQQALLEVPKENPYRGPKEFAHGDYRYANSFAGEVGNFSGEEIISYQGKEIYRGKYMGGLVDQRK